VVCRHQWYSSAVLGGGLLTASPVHYTISTSHQQVITLSKSVCFTRYAAADGELCVRASISTVFVSPLSTVTVDTRSSATAEKQRVSCACLPRLANWSCNAQNTAELQRLHYFWHSKILIQEALAQKRILSLFLCGSWASCYRLVWCVVCYKSKTRARRS